MKFLRFPLFLIACIFFTTASVFAGDQATCAPGQYLPGNISTCDNCPANSYCSGGTFSYPNTKPQGIESCPAGLTSDPSSDSINDCTGTITCNAGEYLPFGSTTCNICSAGNYCIGGKFDFNLVSNQGLNSCEGKWSPLGSDSDDDCTIIQITCNPGEYFHSGTVCASCPNNYWCPGGTFTYDSFNYNDQGRNSCGDGFTSAYGSDSSDDCIENLITCNAGEYLQATTTACQLCSSGYWCPGGAFTPTPAINQGLNSCEGEWSPLGSDSYDDCILPEITCWPGEYLLPDFSLSCVGCPSNNWCPGGTFTFSPDTIQGLNSCGDGFTSGYGSDSSDDCIENSTITCNAGEYLPFGSTTCNICPPNNWCRGGTFTFSPYTIQGLNSCGDGFTSEPGADSRDDCIENSQITCNAGEYLSAKYNTCQPCYSGYWCPGGAFTHTPAANQGLNSCGDGFTSEYGSDSSDDCTALITCSSGEYLPANASECLICPANSYCKGGETFAQSSKDQGIIACPFSRTSEPGSNEEKDCISSPSTTCAPGQYLPAYTSTCDICPANSYCIGGEFEQMISKNQGIDVCPFGGTSDEGSDSSDDCNINQSQINCKPGEFIRSNSYKCEICPVGAWCPGGDFWYPSMSDQELNKCDAGYTSPAGSDSSNDCVNQSAPPCNPGEYLPAGIGVSCKKCPETNWCPGGMWNYHEYSIQGLNPCQVGFASESGSDSEDDCTDTTICDPGEYLPSGSMICNACKASFWCEGGTFQYAASGDQGINSCGVGLGSPIGSSDPESCTNSIICNAGEYLPANKTYCSSCNQNYYCEGGTFQFSETEDQGMTKCPDGGITYHFKAQNPMSCLKESLTFIDLHGTGTQTCYWGGVTYDTNCFAISIKKCDAGYCLNEKYPGTCSEAGYHMYSPNDDLSCYKCPGLKNGMGKAITDTTTSASPTECYIDTFYYNTYEQTPSGVGKLKCFYVGDGGKTGDDEGYGKAEDFDPEHGIIPTNPAATNKQCTADDEMVCFGGFYKPGSFCIPVDDGYFSYRPSGLIGFLDCMKDFQTCVTTYGLNLEQPETLIGKTACPESYTYSVNPRNEEKNCYKKCPPIEVANSTQVKIVKSELYYNSDPVQYCQYQVDCASGFEVVNNNTDDPSCKRKAGQSITCEPGNYLPSDSLQCTKCVAGNYCEGGTFDPTTSNQGISLCPLGGESAEGSKLESDCYKSCSSDGMNIENSTDIIPLLEKIYWKDESYTECIFDVKCITGYHSTKIQDELYCVSDTSGCSDKNASDCDESGVPTLCKAGYHIEDKKCIEDVRTCPIENGLGRQTWMKDNILGGKWTMCTAYQCNPGYTSERYLTNEKDKPCGECKNKRDSSGNIVVSAWAKDACKIATCMYQNELYRFDTLNNSCVQICDTAGREDITGTMLWDPLTEKCERTCNPGFTSW